VKPPVTKLGLKAQNNDLLGSRFRENGRRTVSLFEAAQFRRLKHRHMPATPPDEGSTKADER
jgi:hypothetical protein